MATWTVNMTIRGDAAISVEAESEEQAMELAKDAAGTVLYWDWDEIHSVYPYPTTPPDPLAHEGGTDE